MFDDVLQIALHADNRKSDRKLMRCTDPRSDCVSKVDILFDSKLKCFDKPTYALKTLVPLYEKETVLATHAMKRVKMIKRNKRKELDDLRMVEDFLMSFDRQPEKPANESAVRPAPCKER